jgi:S-DNA-T family DNA segregation ATPase FtsK/SpoIIIE
MPRTAAFDPAPPARRGGGFASPAVRALLARRGAEALALVCGLAGLALALALASYDAGDPSWSTATDREPQNLAGLPGAHVADLLWQSIGWAAGLPATALLTWAWRLATQRGLAPFALRLIALLLALPLGAASVALLPLPAGPAPAGAGGALGLPLAAWLLEQGAVFGPLGETLARLGLLAVTAGLSYMALAVPLPVWRRAARVTGVAAAGAARGGAGWLARRWRRPTAPPPHRAEPRFEERLAAPPGPSRPAWLARLTGRGAPPPPAPLADVLRAADAAAEHAPAPPAIVRPERAEPRVAEPAARKLRAPTQPALDLRASGEFRLPGLDLLNEPPQRRATGPSEEALQNNARLLESVLEDYGVRGAIRDIRPGPVVTLYELEPAPGTKSARVVGLADDIARSMSVTAVRIATVPGRNVIGIEMPNARRETVFFAEMLAGEEWERAAGRLPLMLGKDIGGAPIIADLARMPHLLIAGTTGSGKSVAINTMILSLLYRMTPDECRFIMIDPKMLELSVYDRIPHLLAPVVTEPPKAIGALKWTVREMERRYRAMSQLGVRNIAGYNERVTEARAKGQVLTRKVQTGFDPDTGRPVFEEQPLALEALPMIVVVIDEMADLMIVAGKEIEAAVQRLAQMARAAGIHVIMATQRPSVDVITGTIKANFPTRISFAVTSKIDSRTILGEQGAEQLLGQGDMLHMAPGGRIARVHGPFVTDSEVERVADFLREQGEPAYIEEVTEEDEDGEALKAMGVIGGNTDAEASLYDQAVALVTREGKASTSFVQRHLNIGYNRAAKLIEQMEKEGVVGAANHVGKREVLAPRRED